MAWKVKMMMKMMTMMRKRTWTMMRKMMKMS